MRVLGPQGHGGSGHPPWKARHPIGWLSKELIFQGEARLAPQVPCQTVNTEQQKAKPEAPRQGASPAWGATPQAKPRAIATAKPQVARRGPTVHRLRHGGPSSTRPREGGVAPSAGYVPPIARKRKRRSTGCVKRRSSANACRHRAAGPTAERTNQGAFTRTLVQSAWAGAVKRLPFSSWNELNETPILVSIPVASLPGSTPT